MTPRQVYRKAARYGFKEKREGSCVWIYRALGANGVLLGIPEVKAYTELFAPNEDYNCLYWGSLWGNIDDNFFGGKAAHECRILALLLMSEICK